MQTQRSDRRQTAGESPGDTVWDLVDEIRRRAGRCSEPGADRSWRRGARHRAVSMIYW